MNNPYPHEEDETPECDCCHYPASDLAKYEAHDVLSRAKGENKLLCRLCSHTMTSVYQEYTNLYSSDTTEIMKTICHVGNAIIDAIKGRA
jgi:hypothetical protein